MNKHRWIIMLALPLVLCALLGAAKWKQMHPAATQRDLAERAYLSKAKIVNLAYEGNYISIPVDELGVTQLGNFERERGLLLRLSAPRSSVKIFNCVTPMSLKRL